jgi:hypothetical protein
VYVLSKIKGKQAAITEAETEKIGIRKALREV